MINIPNDLRKNKDKIIGNMDLRECTFVFLGCTLAIAFLYYFRIVLGYERVVILAFFAGLIVIPFLFFGFKKINGMKVDDYIKVFINNNILSQSVRINKYNPVDVKVQDKKYELLRYYKFKDKEEIVKLRQTLLDKKVLYLTESISYKGEQYMFFRIDCKNMELLQEKRNRDDILEKNKEIIESKKKFHKLISNVNKLRIRNLKNRLLKKINEEEKIKSLIDEKNVTKNKIKELKSIRKKLKSKSIEDFKNEIDIFENYGVHTAQRVDDIRTLKENISNDERKVYEINLYNKLELKEIVKDLDRIIFISNEGKVNMFLYEDIDFQNKTKDFICDLIDIDKKQGLYNSIKMLGARNFYNFYREVNSLEEIL